MGLPSRLTSLIKKISTGSVAEDKLLKLFVTRLKHSLSTLEKLFGSECSKGCFRRLIRCILYSGNTACFDQYAASVEDAITRRRSLTDQEDLLVGEMINEIVGMTEVLLELAGVTLTESESEESGTGATGAIGAADATDLRAFSPDT